MTLIGPQTAPGRLFSILIFTAKILLGLLILYSITGVHEFKSSVPRESYLNVSSLVYFQESESYDWERAQFIMDLKLKLSNISQWNMRQIYVYVYAEFRNGKGEVSRVTVWDKVLKPVGVEGGSKGVGKERLEGWDINHTGIKTPYQLRDTYKSLRGQEIVFKVGLNYLPEMGLVSSKTLTSCNFTMPAHYIKLDPKPNH